jgi:acyl-CoA synthetase (AMP-forming)/AMP-acid ligase II
MPLKTSFVQGSSEPPLLDITFGDLIDQQAELHGNRPFIISDWQETRWTYQEFSDRSKALAKSLLEIGLRYGDHVGVFLGVCYEYCEVLAAAGRIGCPSISFNLTYTPSELSKAAEFTRKPTVPSS